MKPLKDHIIIKIDGVPEKIGMIIMPQTVTSKAICTGVVQSVGEGEWLIDACRYEPPNVAVGQRVMFSSLAGVYIDEKKTLLTIRQCDIYGIIEGKSDATMENRVNIQMRKYRYEL